MLKKGQQLKLKRHNSTMSVVYQSIRDGNHTTQKICVDTRLLVGKVRSAVWNLVYVGMIHQERENGVTRYFVGDTERPKSYNSPATNFIFNPHKD